MLKSKMTNLEVHGVRRKPHESVKVTFAASLHGFRA